MSAEIEEIEDSNPVAIDIMALGYGHKSLRFRKLIDLLKDKEKLEALLKKLDANYILSQQIDKNNSRQIADKKVSTLTELKAAIRQAVKGGAKQLMLRPPIVRG